jgi:hypothetical protein
MKRLMFSVALGALALSGTVRFVPAAQEPASRPAEVVAEGGAAAVSRVADLARVLALSNEAELKALASVLETEPGRIVLADRVSGAEASERQRRAAEALPRFLEKNFAKGQTAAEAAAVRAEFVRISDQIGSDLKTVAEGLRGVESRLEADESDAGRLLRRFVREEGAAPVLYVLHLRQRLRPDDQVVVDSLQEIFYRGEDGRYRLKGSRLEEAERTVAQGRAIEEAGNRFAPEFADWTKELVPGDGLQGRLKLALANSLMTSYTAEDLYDGDSTEVSAAEGKYEEFFGYLEDLTEDSAEGLRVVEDRRSELEELLEGFESRARAVGILRPAVGAFASKLAMDDKATAAWGGFLKTDAGLHFVARQTELGASDPAGAVGEFLANYLVESEGGKLSLPEENRAGLREAIEEMLGAHREFRRKNRRVDAFRSEADPEIGARLGTPAGKLALTGLLRESQARDVVDGLALWKAEHFDEGDDGSLTLREDARGAIGEMLAEVESMNKELARDDF